MRLAHVLLSLAVTTVVSAADAWACSCMPSGPPCQGAFQVDAIFAGTVRSITPLPEDDPSPLPPGSVRIPSYLRIEFDDVVPYRGLQAAQVSLVTAGSGPACGYGFRRGERYLVYATRNKQGGLVASLCSRTRPLAEAAEDLQFLKTLSAPAERARLYGTVTHAERDLATEQPKNHGGVPNLRVNVSGSGLVVDTWTDEAGRYDVRLPPGKYSVTFVPPPGFSTKYMDHSVELRDARACEVLDSWVRFDGRIRGILDVPPGESSAEIPIELMAAESIGKRGNVPVLRTTIDSAGRFEFSELSPGRYVVGVDLIRRLDAKVVFPTTFHPGTPDASSATVVELRGGQQRDLPPMRLPPPRRRHQLVGTVVFEDGRPASDVLIALSDGATPFLSVTPAVTSGPDGTFSFLVHEGLSYLARAWFWDERQRTQVRGTAGPFVAGVGMTPLKVVIAPAR